MLSERIQSWLNGSRNFIVGRALYKQLGIDDTIKEKLLKGENAGTKIILVEAMQALLLKPVLITPVAVPATDVMPGSDDAVLQALANEWKPLYARMNYLRASLDQYGESNDVAAIAERESIAFEILALDDQCEDIWAKRDYYLEHGHLPAVQVDEVQLPVDPILLAKLLETIKRNIRRNKAKMAIEGADAKFAQLYVHYKAQYKQVTGKDYDEKN